MNDRPLIVQLGNQQLSSYRQYLRIFVGKESLAAFVRYELLTSILGPLTGSLGYFLRAKFYRSMFESVGEGTMFGRGIVVRSPRQISLGAHVALDDGVVLDAKGSTSSIILGDQILVGRNSILSCNEAQIQIGSFVSIGPFCFFACKSRITIGSNVAIGSASQFMAGGHVTNQLDIPIIRQPRTSKGITVGDGAWIGTGVIILDGVTVGHNSIVGAGAVVSKDVPPWTVAMGNPARVVEKRKETVELEPI